MASNDGMNYAPTGKPDPVVEPGEFCFAVTAMDHGHIIGQANGLTEAGATLKYVFDPNHPEAAQSLAEQHNATVPDSLQTILDDPEVQLVAAAAIPNERAPLGIKCMDAGKHYFTDKTPLVSLEQLEHVKAAVARTGKKYMVYFSERLHVECAMHATTLVEQGAIGKVIQVTGFGPHRLGPPENRPDWFYKHEQYGGILCDIGSHQIEQFLTYAGCKDATIQASKVANYNHPGYPELEDFGDCTLIGDNGATMYFRVDWFTPDKLRTWGDGRTFITGTEGTIELRKYVDVAQPDHISDVLILVNSDGEQRMELSGKVGFKFFGQLIRDLLDGTENAMTQEHALKAAELCVRAQMQAQHLTA
ncbi:Gfo/Idh/MocA family protein [Algisphaera agarilytica]|uniref:Putative dehydrogenase n=1 Tax=Algisphaera agarilytica TaxID=1385975 RepID=A0A7X0H565_9BACT|nr:Gfo/Idh/MocA family oxidoreductase [Algisphaera agarilytica]MBB6429247.1 putative dehydrogenase [Algisphaera agarilytica]